MLSVRTFTSKYLHDNTRGRPNTNIKIMFCNWKQYVDDTHAYVEPTIVELIWKKLNNYDLNLNFTFELEKNNEINFLDVLIKRVNNNKLETAVYQKPTSSDIISTGMHMHQQNEK